MGWRATHFGGPSRSGEGWFAASKQPTRLGERSKKSNPCREGREVGPSGHIQALSDPSANDRCSALPERPWFQSLFPCPPSLSWHKLRVSRSLCLCPKRQIRRFRPPVLMGAWRRRRNLVPRRRSRTAQASKVAWALRTAGSWSSRRQDSKQIQPHAK